MFAKTVFFFEKKIDCKPDDEKIRKAFQLKELNNLLKTLQVYQDKVSQARAPNRPTDGKFSILHGVFKKKIFVLIAGSNKYANPTSKLQSQDFKTQSTQGVPFHNPTPVTSFGTDTAHEYHEYQEPTTYRREDQL